MGWAESPPYFCAATETVADLANSRLQDPSHVPEEHHFDDLAHATPAENAVPTTHAPTSAVSVPTKRDPCLQHSSTNFFNMWISLSMTSCQQHRGLSSAESVGHSFVPSMMSSGPLII
eukprot:scaffold17347_cov68-Skeletonema_marinoi.AAC.2